MKSPSSLLTFDPDQEPESGVVLQRHVANAAGWWPGMTIAGKYRIERLIAEGAMGLVLAATHLGLDERVAIKLIRPELRRDPFTVSRFAREAKALARIKSEHVVRVLDVGVSLPLGPYIVMEYLEGRDLAETLQAEGAFSVERAVRYLLQACEALARAHSAGITHQDIKPGNLFLARSGDLDLVKVLDFGISRGALEGRIFGGDLAVRGRATRLMGTPSYNSPEHLRDDPAVDHRSDIWSLGVVLHELLTGAALFVGESETDVCAQVLALKAPPACSPHIPAKLRRIISRCLALPPSERYRDVAELAQALSPFARRAGGLRALRVAFTRGEPSVREPHTPRIERQAFRSRSVRAALWVLTMVLVGAALVGAALAGGEVAGEGGSEIQVEPVLRPPAPVVLAPVVPESREPSAASQPPSAEAAAPSGAAMLESSSGAEKRRSAPVRSRSAEPFRATLARLVRSAEPPGAEPSGETGSEARSEAPSGRARLIEERPRIRLVEAPSPR